MMHITVEKVTYAMGRVFDNNDNNMSATFAMQHNVDEPSLWL